MENSRQSHLIPEPVPFCCTLISWICAHLCVKHLPWQSTVCLGLQESLGFLGLSPNPHSFHLIPVYTPKYSIPIFYTDCVSQTGPGMSWNDSLGKDLTINPLWVSYKFSTKGPSKKKAVHGLVRKSELWINNYSRVWLNVTMREKERGFSRRYIWAETNWKRLIWDSQAIDRQEHSRRRGQFEHLLLEEKRLPLSL